VNDVKPRQISLSAWTKFRLATDLAVGLAALILAFQTRISLPLPLTVGLLPADRFAFLTLAAILVLASQNLGLYFFGFYELSHPRSRFERARGLVSAVVVQCAAIATFYFFANRVFPRSVLIVFGLLNLLFLWFGRALLDRLYRPPDRRVVIVGSGQEARDLAEDLLQYPWHRVQICGHVAAPGEARCPGTEEPDSLGEDLGTIEDLPGLVAQGFVDEILVAGATGTWQTQLVDELTRMPERRASVLLFPGPFDSLVGRMHYRSVHDIPLIEVVPDTSWRQGDWLRRTYDLLIASLCLLLTLPLLLLCGLLIRLTSRGPMLYSQTRIGRNQKPFTLWKLRTMHVGAEGEDEILARPNDPRKTAVGGWLRGLRIDEIPQLFNVLTGSMSLVGPRPERPGFVKKYLREVPGYSIRFAVRPGLTGLAQVNGDYRSSAENKLRYDLAYLANWNPLLDLSILLRTIRIVLTSKGI
jgi:exopolysaccharide biosynthesis polyprenyl glycosylphosphotransferase